MKGQRGERGDASEFVSGIHLYVINLVRVRHNEESVLTKPNSFGLVGDRL